jgi:membrane dipeptidase
MENGAGIEDDLANLRHFRERGIGYVTLTHSEDNLICDSSYSDPASRRWHGLSPFGREVVAEMNRLGILVDISHVSDEAFDAVLAATLAPPIASHSSCRYFTPGFERNLDDERIRRLAEAGGVIQINFGSGFLTAAANAWAAEAMPAAKAFTEERGVGFESSEFKAWMADYLAARPLPRADLDDVVAHIEHVIAVAGVDHVGFGSDFDGVGPTLPEGLSDVSMYPHLIARLLERGHSEADLEKIAGGNLLRVWRDAERVARELQAEAAH